MGRSLPNNTAQSPRGHLWGSVTSRQKPTKVPSPILTDGPTARGCPLEVDTHRNGYPEDGPFSAACQMELCVPSQYGAVFVCLQPQRYAILGSTRVNVTGVNPVPWWEPSHMGCVFDRPQAHQ